LSFAGTFEAEKREEVLAYGLVHPLKTHDPIHAQVMIPKSQNCISYILIRIIFK
jgi:hypothetical protein